jgi:hypothetical protein
MLHQTITDRRCTLLTVWKHFNRNGVHVLDEVRGSVESVRETVCAADGRLLRCLDIRTDAGCRTVYVLESEYQKVTQH